MLFESQYFLLLPFVMNQVVVLSPDPPTAGIRALIESAKYLGRVTYVQVYLSLAHCIGCWLFCRSVMMIFQVSRIGNVAGLSWLSSRCILWVILAGHGGIAY